MHKFFLIFLLSLSTLSYCGWTQLSPLAAEKQRIYQQITSIKNQYSARSSARNAAIFEYLKNLNTQASYEVLQEMVQSGQLPAHLLAVA